MNRKSTGKRFRIDVQDHIDFLTKAYGLRCKIMNWYTIRLWHEEFLGFFDYFHTTGTVTMNTKYSCQRIAMVGTNAENLAILIRGKVYV